MTFIKLEKFSFEYYFIDYISNISLNILSALFSLSFWDLCNAKFIPIDGVSQVLFTFFSLFLSVPQS